jgi:hypothetical protein
MTGDQMVSSPGDDDARREQAAELVRYWDYQGYREQWIAAPRLLLLTLPGDTLIEAGRASEEQWLGAARVELDRKPAARRLPFPS